MLESLKRAYRGGRQAANLVWLPMLRARRTNICCCGLSKTGTHSLAGIFANYRSAHHFDREIRIGLAMDRLRGCLDVDRAGKLLMRRDRLFNLEVESSALAGILIEPLVKACPDKRFILTLRDVYSWCDSWIDHSLNSPVGKSSPFAALDRLRLRSDEIQPTRFDVPLVERGCPPLASYFRMWTDHNSKVLRSVPEGRLLIAKTPDITPTLPDIATWAGVPIESLRKDRAWLYAAPRKYRILSTLDAGYVRESADRYCGDLMRRFFPGAQPA